MKNLLIAMVLMFSSSVLFSQEPYKMQVGDQLVYQVEAGGNEYDFTVTPTKLSAKGISFEYKMSAPANQQGIVNMNADALKNATAMYNRFGGGTVNLTDQTSVFASKAMMDAAADGIGGFYVNGPNEDAEDYTTLEGMDSPTNGSTYIRWIKEINGKEYSLDGPIMENSNGTKAIRFTDGGGFPFITFMEIDFKIYLKEIIRAE